MLSSVGFHQLAECSQSITNKFEEILSKYTALTGHGIVCCCYLTAYSQRCMVMCLCFCPCLFVYVDFGCPALICACLFCDPLHPPPPTLCLWAYENAVSNGKAAIPLPSTHVLGQYNQLMVCQVNGAS